MGKRSVDEIKYRNFGEIRPDGNAMRRTKILIYILMVAGSIIGGVVMFALNSKVPLVISVIYLILLWHWLNRLPR